MSAADEIRKLIAEADSESAKADREKLPITTAFYGGAAKYLGHALAIVEREASRTPDRAALARAIAAEILRQDDVEDANLADDLKIAYLDQGEVDFGLVADAVLAALPLPAPTSPSKSLRRQQRRERPRPNPPSLARRMRMAARPCERLCTHARRPRGRRGAQDACRL